MARDLQQQPEHVEPVALVTGATGVAGSAVVDYLAGLDGWHVVAVWLGAPETTTKPNVTMLPADLLDKESIREKLSAFRITHLFHVAEYRQPRPNDSHEKPVNVRAIKAGLRIAWCFMPLVAKLGPRLEEQYYGRIENVARLGDPGKKNLAMLRNAVEVLEEPPHRLQHVAVVTGGGYYGMHMGPYLYPGWKIPFEEGDPRHPGPSKYFDIEDFLHGQASSWTWSVVRPSFIIGFSSGSAHNFGTGIAVYASILKELGEPLIFPGGLGAYRCLWEASSATLVARMMHWSATEPAAANQAFNIVNGEQFQWCDLWPTFADYFGMDVSVPNRGCSVQRMFRDKEPVWRNLVAKHGIEDHAMPELLSPRFLDESMVIDWDVEFSMAKARHMGFDARVDNAQMFLDFFDRLRTRNIIP